MLNTFGAVRDGIGQGLIPDGTVSTPAIRFASDQDSGIARASENTLALVVGGIARASLNSSGLAVTGDMRVRDKVLLQRGSGALDLPIMTYWNGVGGPLTSGNKGDILAIGSAGGDGLVFVNGDVERARFDVSGNLGLGTKQPTSRLDIILPGAEPRVRFASSSDNPALEMYRYTGAAGLHYGARLGMNLGSFVLEQAGGSGIGSHGWVERLRVDEFGNLQVGTASGTEHRIRKDVPANNGSSILGVLGSGAFSAMFYSISGGLGSSANAAMKVATDGVTNRSINAGGTINASGADYAEYMVKAAGCGVIGKGDICGVDRDGKLTKTWADAISFVVKSSDPSYVGNDKWADHLPARPEQPSPEPLAPAVPAEPADDADKGAIEAWQAAQAAYPSLLAAYHAEHAAWQHATDTYAADLAAWEQDLEAARQCVDRIAFCGQVPCNVAGDFEVGDYIIAAAVGAGIKAVAVKPDEMTLPQYMRRIGKVWAIRDGRPWIDVQHG